MKKALTVLGLAGALALTLGLAACGSGGTGDKFEDLTTAESVYGFSAASAGDVLPLTPDTLRKAGMPHHRMAAGPLPALPVGAGLFTDDGSLRPVSSLGERAHCIASVIPGAGGKAVGTLVPKIKAIELYAKYLNLVRTEAPQVNILPVVEVVPKSGSAEEWNGESDGQ